MELKETTAVTTSAPPVDLLRPVREFRKMVVRFSFVLICAAALAAFAFNATAGHGILLGGLGGILGFWLMARRVEKFASVPASQIKLDVYKATFFRLVLYALVLGKAYTLDPETMVGFLSAAGGILAIRLVIVLVGITSLDLRNQRAE